MLQLLQSINLFVSKLVQRETDSINQARVRMLTYILILYLPYTAILIAAYYFGGETQHLIRVSTVFITCALLLSVIYYTQAWKIASHIVLSALTLAVWSNILFYAHNVNVETLQFIWFASALSFFMHGLKWGSFYSTINVIPVLIYTAFEDKIYFYIGNGPYEVTQATYLFVIAYNFLWVIYMHYYFFKTFNRNFLKLTSTKNELKELNKKLTATLSDLKNTSDARMNFLSTMSHELRTPLNGVIGISNALLLQNPREDQEENLAVLKFSAENLLLLINDVLDFNKFDSDKAELENIPFNLTELIKNNYSSLKLNAREKMLDLNLSITDDLTGKIVISDPTRLTQVLLNLLNNAIKFTENGFVSLQIETINLTKSRITLRFTIEDSGIGIDPQKQQYIFEPFMQASTSINRNYGGTGLGLPIVKKVLTMFNSKVNMVSTPQVGTKFFFDIDFEYQIAKTQTSTKSINTGFELAKLRVLVAEDNPVNILVIKKTLERWNILPVIAENGAIALQELELEDFDIVLMDLYMPIMDGYQTASAIRKMDNKVKASVPIIALTATVSDNVTEKVTEAGMNDYLPKPFNPEHLYTKLKKLTIEAEELSKIL